MNKFISLIGKVEDHSVGAIVQAPLGIGKMLTHLATLYAQSEEKSFWTENNSDAAGSLVHGLNALIDATRANGFLVTETQARFLSAVMDVTGRASFGFSLVVGATLSLDHNQQKKIAQMAKAYSDAAVSIGKLLAVLEVFNPGFSSELRELCEKQSGMVPLIIPKERASAVIELWNDVKTAVESGAKIEREAGGEVLTNMTEQQTDFLQSLLYKKGDELLPDALVQIMEALESQHSERKTH